MGVPEVTKRFFHGEPSQNVPGMLLLGRCCSIRSQFIYSDRSVMQYVIVALKLKTKSNSRANKD